MLVLMYSEKCLPVFSNWTVPGNTNYRPLGTHGYGSRRYGSGVDHNCITLDLQLIINGVIQVATPIAFKGALNSSRGFCLLV